jgi:transcription antitermination factor NusG
MANVWAVARVIINREFFVSQQLTDHDVIHYLPRYRIADGRNRRGPWRRKRWHRRPLYPGYAFIEHASVPALRSLATVLSDIVGLVMVGDQLATSPALDRDLAALKASEGASGFVPAPAIADVPMFQVGHLVLVRSGPFRGQTGSVGRISDDTVSVTLDMLGRKLDVKHTIAALEAA